MTMYSAISPGAKLIGEVLGVLRRLMSRVATRVVSTGIVSSFPISAKMVSYLMSSTVWTRLGTVMVTFGDGSKTRVLSPILQEVGRRVIVLNSVANRRMYSTLAKSSDRKVRDASRNMSDALAGIVKRTTAGSAEQGVALMKLLSNNQSFRSSMWLVFTTWKGSGSLAVIIELYLYASLITSVLESNNDDPNPNSLRDMGSKVIYDFLLDIENTLTEDKTLSFDDRQAISEAFNTLRSQFDSFSDFDSNDILTSELADPQSVQQAVINARSFFRGWLASDQDVDAFVKHLAVLHNYTFLADSTLSDPNPVPPGAIEDATEALAGLVDAVGDPAIADEATQLIGGLDLDRSDNARSDAIKAAGEALINEIMALDDPSN